MFKKEALRNFCVSSVILACSSFAFAISQNYSNYNQQLTSTSYLTINPNDYDFLVYNCHGSEESIGAAMEILGISNYTERDGDDPVTADDLATHDILITSWNIGGDSSGLDSSILYNGITGRIILTGHDADYHTANGPEEGKILFSQMIDYVLTSSNGTGLIGLADATSTFNWIPYEWNISATNNYGNNITEFTPEGLDSGIYDSLTPALMSGWNTSYHNTFSDWGGDFVLFELGGYNGDEAITIASTNIGSLILVKDDGMNEGDCVVTDDFIEYQISYSNPVTDPNEPGYVGDANDVVITDYLPAEGVDFVSASPSGWYDPNERTYTWDIGLLSPGEGGTLLLKVQVAGTIEPLSEIINKVELKSDVAYKWATEKTPVCCFGGEVIYVDESVNAPDPNGSSWGTAFSNLIDAIATATICDEIWVADGIYKLTTYPYDTDATFPMVNGVGVYGGFLGGVDGETDRRRGWRDRTL